MRRSRIEQLISVLEVVEHDSVPTHIMYKANLSWKGLNQLLEILIDKGMVVNEPGRMLNYYLITGGGLQVLKLWRELNILMKVE